MFKEITLATAMICTCSAAQADSIYLTSEMQAASLNTGGISTVAYYMEKDDHFELVVTYVSDWAPSDPARLRMAMTNGDDVSFSMPGESQVLYNFRRDGDVISISADLAGEATTQLVD